jgi:hypothetical protein
LVPPEVDAIILALLVDPQSSAIEFTDTNFNSFGALMVSVVTLLHALLSTTVTV